MSGIVGLFDPTGIDTEHLLLAADRASYRGSIELRSYGSVALGSYARRPSDHGFVESGSSVLVADARVDAPLPGSVGERLSRRHSGDSLLGAILDEAGPEGLDGMAADFALARWEARSGELLLARDAFAMRPLYWARRGRRFGFAPDPTVLIALGLVTGELEFDVVAQAVAGGDPVGEPTAFAGVRHVRGGHWIAVDVGGGVRRGRWFRPELVSEEPVPFDLAVERVREAVVGAVASRARGEQVAILLSGGRDSGAVAAAAHLAGVTAHCVTQHPDPDTDPPEAEAARILARAMGHEWEAVPVGTNVTSDDLIGIPELAGSPIGLDAFTPLRALRAAAAGAGATTIIGGEGGDPLFDPSLAAVTELVKSGRLRLATRAARAFRNNWRYTYPVVIKGAGRAIAPRSLLAFRERLRARPPWAASSSPDRTHEPRSARTRTLAFLASIGGSPYLELFEQLYQRAGMTYASPLYDQRVVRAALALPIELRLPIPEAKPMLSAALLGHHSATRVKASYLPYFVACAEGLHRDFPWLFESGSLCAKRGYVRGPVGRLGTGAKWLAASLSVVPTEMWLRGTEGLDGRRGRGGEGTV